MSRDVDLPYGFDHLGRTADTPTDDHIRDMIEQVLFTSPGERVNRPDFGSGILQLVFAPNSPELAAALQLTAQASLVRWLGDVVDVRDLRVAAEDSTLRVEVDYAIRGDVEVRTAAFVEGAR